MQHFTCCFKTSEHSVHVTYFIESIHRPWIDIIICVTSEAVSAQNWLAIL